MSFVHLHVHTAYSLLESTVKVSQLIARTKELGMPAVAITDHGNMFGAVDFYLSCKANDIKPILGCEIYYTTGSRLSRAAKASKRVLASAEDQEAARNYRLVLLCKDAKGYANLCELVTRGYTEGFDHKPRVDRELIEQFSGGLIALTAGLKGEIGFHCTKGLGYEAAEKSALWLKEVFKEDLFLEVQENGFPEQSKINSWVLDFAKSQGVPTVATADVHYLDKQHAAAHEVLMCIGAGRNLDENRAARLCTDEFYFKDEPTMLAQFQWNEEAVRNTALVADRCQFSFKLKDEKGRQIYYLPDFRPEDWPEEKEDGVNGKFHVEEFLRAQAKEGLQERLTAIEALAQATSGQMPDRSIYEKRLDEELNMICKTGFAGYFLVVSDFIKYAKSQGIPVGPGRGSGAGSLVAYSLKITDLDPIPFNLLFERFINPERISMPDFDVDFCQDRRQEVIDYVVRKYGRDKVSQIVTFGKLLARGVIRDVGRVMGLSYGDVDALAKLIPEELGITLDEAFEKEPRLRDLTNRDPKIHKLFETARALEGLNRHASVHAAGVVITNAPLVSYCPLMTGKEGEAVVQYDKDFAEKIGLVKYDFLGLKTLTVIDNAVKFVRETEPSFNLEKMSYSDPKVFKLISSGDTDGVFQLESSGMKDLCMRVQPSHLEDITAINALYRPGPLNSGMVDDYINRKHGKTPVVYELPQLEEILRETYGVIVYQEQVMRVARVLANYSLGEADILRRAMGKKKPEEMAKQRDKFVAGCVSNSVAKDKAERLFDLLAKFAEYGFNKSHSAAYGVLSYQTAYLKAYYPAQFMAALMATEMDNTEKMAQYISDARKRHIQILPPDVNASKKTFSVVTEKESTAIRFGLEAIKGVGGVAVDAILLNRTEHGKFQSFIDFCKRVPLRKVNKKVLESLISTGAFDSIAEENRATLFESLEEVIKWAGEEQSQADLGQVSFFDQYQSQGLKLEPTVTHLFKRVPDWIEARKLQMEKQLVGFYVSGHPMDKWGTVIKNFIHGDLHWIKEEYETRKQKGQAAVAKAQANGAHWEAVRDAGRWEIITAALVTSFREIVTKKGSRMAFVELEDARTKIEAVCFPEPYEACVNTIKQSIENCSPVVIQGQVSLDEETPKIFIRTMDFAQEYQKRKISNVVFRLNPAKVNTHLLAQLRAALVRHQGKCPAFIEYQGAEFASRLSLPRELSVNPSTDLVSEVNELFGHDVVKMM